jgi:hypothetical protein
MKSRETLGLLEVAGLIPEATKEKNSWHQLLEGKFSKRMTFILIPCLAIDPILGAVVGFVGFIFASENLLKSRGDNSLRRIYAAKLTREARNTFLQWKRQELGGQQRFERTPNFWFVGFLLLVLLLRAFHSIYNLL